MKVCRRACPRFGEFRENGRQKTENKKDRTERLGGRVLVFRKEFRQSGEDAMRGGVL